MIRKMYIYLFICSVKRKSFNISVLFFMKKGVQAPANNGEPKTIELRGKPTQGDALDEGKKSI